MENMNNINNAEELLSGNITHQESDTEKKDEMESQTDSAVTKEIVVKQVSALEGFIPEDEKAVEIETPSEYANAKETGYFSSAAGMAQLENVLGDCVYAAVTVDEKGKRFIQYCQKYNNGSFSAKMSIAQSDLLFASMNNFMLTDIKIPVMKTKLNKFIVSVTEDYLGKLNGDTPLNIQELLTALCSALNKLPVYTDKVEATPEQFYMEVVEKINECMPKSIFEWIYRKSYYALTDDRLEYLAQEMRTTPKNLLKKLKEYGFLYITPSSKGYQTKVRFDTEQTDWAYCILRLEYLGKQGIENKTV